MMALQTEVESVHPQKGRWAIDRFKNQYRSQLQGYVSSIRAMKEPQNNNRGETSDLQERNSMISQN